MDSKDVLILISEIYKYVTLLGKRDFAGAIKLKGLEMEKLSWIVWMGSI